MNDVILVVESGATKTDWRAASAVTSPVDVRTAGMNLATMSEDSVRAIVEEAAAAFSQAGVSDNVSEIHYYAAGLIVSGEGGAPPQATALDKVLRTCFPKACIEYASDLLDAARAVCGHRPGIAAILGTGSNSCLYDGERIVKNVRSAGFILGDEGGGASLGRMFMADFLKGLVPEEVSKEFAADFKVDYMTVVGNVYHGTAPSKYLGSFAPWIMERYDRSEYIKDLADNNFRSFIERCLLQYDIKSHPVGVVGGFGYAHRAVLLKVAEPYGIKFSTIVPAPIESLVDYHLGKN